MISYIFPEVSLILMYHHFYGIYQITHIRKLHAFFRFLCQQMLGIIKLICSLRTIKADT